MEYINMDIISWELSDGVWGRSPDKREEGSSFRSIHFRELLPPDTPDGIWSVDHDDLGVNTRDVSFWLDGDALCLVESTSQGSIWRIHFRHISTGQTHQRAFAPFIDFSRGSHLIWGYCEPLCYEERVLLQFYDHLDHDRTRQTAAIVLDWTTGEVMMPYTITLDTTFLTKDLLILAIPVATEQSTTLLEIRSLKSDNASYRCELPISWTDCGVRFLNHPSSNQGANCPTRYAKLFIPDPSLDILSIVLKDSESRYSRTVVLSINLFLRKCRRLTTLYEHTEEHVTPTFEWDQWGPDVTRWLPDNFLGEFGSRTVYGARMVAVLFEGRGGLSKYYNILLDFNPRAIRRRLPEGNGDGYNLRVETGEAEDKVYGRAIKSRLPYRAWLSTVEEQYWNLSLEANTIIARTEDMFHFFSFLPRDPSHSGEPLPPRML
ncbi:hypothetical protein M408DRAFT_197287 [Serendipita vermifera MAFF 305830]|uniref:Uncharacterized protein n=1 Tax=Serendipita vermifera MAFF 305830 TaxID=933852 RepID=A0A0C3ANP6_SERVB|nr:hypothetical protein M408DRAFT_197287 [Serendipita vermifera MAFF 305830]